MNHTFRPHIETAIHDFLSGDRKEENSSSSNSVPCEKTEPQEPVSISGAKTPWGLQWSSLKRQYPGSALLLHVWGCVCPLTVWLQQQSAGPTVFLLISDWEKWLCIEKQHPKLFCLLFAAWRSSWRSCTAWLKPTYNFKHFGHCTFYWFWRKLYFVVLNVVKFRNFPQGFCVYKNVFHVYSCINSASNWISAQKSVAILLEVNYFTF